MPMDLYDYPEIYDERWSDGANRVYRKHYEKVLDIFLNDLD